MLETSLYILCVYVCACESRLESVYMCVCERENYSIIESTFS